MTSTSRLAASRLSLMEASFDPPVHGPVDHRLIAIDDLGHHPVAPESCDLVGFGPEGAPPPGTQRFTNVGIQFIWSLSRALAAEAVASELVKNSAFLSD